MAARNEADLLGATLRALAAALPGARLWVADDASTDGTADVAGGVGAAVVRSGRHEGKGAAMTRAAEAALAAGRPDAGLAAERTFVLCDGDLGASAGKLVALAEAVESGVADLVVASFADPRGGGIGILRIYAQRSLHARCGLRLRAPLSGQRALGARSLREVLPFADGFGMEAAMTLDAVAAGLAVAELELDLQHRSGGRTPAGFAHRGRQMFDVSRALRARE